MNEELQREIVSILRAMKDGSPDAFKVLVEQRSLYCWGQAILGALMLVAACLMYRLGRWGAKRWAENENSSDGGPYTFTTLTCAFGCLITSGFGVKYIFAIPEAIAPLGRVLEILR